MFTKTKTISMDIITSNPLIYTMEHPGFIVSNFMENSTGLKSRPPDKSAYRKITFLISQPKPMLWVLEKNRLNETVLLNTQNICLNR